jgi:hypothetical protein
VTRPRPLPIIAPLVVVALFAALAYFGQRSLRPRSITPPAPEAAELDPLVLRAVTAARFAVR